MKRKKFYRCIASLFTAAALLGAGILCTACGNQPDGNQPDGDEGNRTPHVQALDYTESTRTIANPDQGFYRPIYVKATESGVTYNANIISNATQLYHLRIDISAFSTNGGGSDKPLTDSALEGLRGLLSLLRSRDKNAVVRFAYDAGYNGKANAEPNMELLLSHARQFCAVLNEFPATVTALEAGMFGPWGEMHTSKIALEPGNIPTLIETLLTNTTEIPVLVRTPKMIYDYLGISANEAEGYVVPESAYRLGIFNDGYLGSSSDLGTYSNRERDVAFIAGQSAHLPYGGEVVVPSSEYHNIQTCLPEMYQIHLSYLNVEWNNIVVDNWKKATVNSSCQSATECYYGKSAFTYIENHMGYRFVLKNSVLSYEDDFDGLDISLTIENVGFGNLNKRKHAKLFCISREGNATYEKIVEDYSGENVLKYSFTQALPSGTYDVYLQLYSDSLNGSPIYTVEFANDRLYNEDLQANKIGEFEIQ